MADLKVIKRSGVSTAIPDLAELSGWIISGAVTTGDKKALVRVGPKLAGHNIVSVAAAVLTASSSGTPTIQIARGRQSAPGSAHTWVDVLSTRITIDQGEYDSKDATTAAVIDTANDDLALGDLLRIDVDVAGTGAQDLIISIDTQKP